MLKCYGCGKGFASGSDMVEWSLVRALMGEKSGLIGVYSHPQNPENDKDYIHTDPSCLDAAFTPMSERNFMWDILADQVRQQIYEEETERDPADDPSNMYEVYEIILEDPPYCLWCKRKDTVWCNFSKGYVVHNCVVCRKLWDQEEDELEWDQEKGDYFLVE